MQHAPPAPAAPGRASAATPTPAETGRRPPAGHPPGRPFGAPSRSRSPWPRGATFAPTRGLAARSASCTGSRRGRARPV
eukprot:scaffold24755_cov63-Phaeocystis_antarctica.AAC.8